MNLGAVYCSFNRAGSISGMPTGYGFLFNCVSNNENLYVYFAYGINNKITNIYAKDARQSDWSRYDCDV